MAPEKSAKEKSNKKLIIIIISIVIAIGLIFFFWPGYPPYKFIANLLDISSSGSAKDDFGCWPPSCSFIPNAQGKQLCEDWKVGKNVTWPADCKMMQTSACIDLCELEKKNNPQGSQDFTDNRYNQEQVKQGPPRGIPDSDPESGSVYIYISDQASCETNCTVTRAGNRSIPDSRIIRIDDLTGKNWVSFGTFGKGLNQFKYPNHVTVGSDGKIYLADSRNDRIVRIDDMTGKGWITYGTSGRTGEPSTPSQVNLPPGEGLFIQPSAVAFDSKGRIYIVSGTELARIDDMTGKGWTTFGSAGSGANQFFKGKSLAIDTMDRIYFVDAGNHRIVRIDDMTGAGWVTFGTKGSGAGPVEDELNGVTLDAQGRIYLGDEHNLRVVRIDDMTGKGWVEFGGLPNDKFGQPHAFGITKAGHIYVLDTTKQRIVRIDDMTGKGWIAFAPYATVAPDEYKDWTMAAPHGMFVLERK